VEIMPEWIRVTMEILNTGMIIICILLLLVIWLELRSHRRELESEPVYMEETSKSGPRLDSIVLTNRLMGK